MSRQDEIDAAAVDSLLRDLPAGIAFALVAATITFLVVRGLASLIQ